MTLGKLVTKSGKVIVAPCVRTTNIFDRMRGLLLRPAPKPGAALLIDPCASIHTFAMSYPIDVVYLDDEYRVVRRIDGMRPWRISACKAARMTLELAAGQAQALGVAPNLELEWRAG